MNEDGRRMSEINYQNKDKVIDDLLLLIAKKNKRIKELEVENNEPQENRNEKK